MRNYKILGVYNDYENVIYNNCSLNYEDCIEYFYGIYMSDLDDGYYDNEFEVWMYDNAYRLKGYIKDIISDYFADTGASESRITIDWLIKTKQWDALQELADDYIYSKYDGKYKKAVYYGTVKENEQLRQIYKDDIFTTEDFENPIIVKVF